jgi:uncharacterized protein (DUF342 family)
MSDYTDLSSKARKRLEQATDRYFALPSNIEETDRQCLETESELGSALYEVHELNVRQETSFQGSEAIAEEIMRRMQNSLREIMSERWGG